MSDNADTLVSPGFDVRLAQHDAASTGAFHRKSQAGKQLKHDLKRLASLQDMLYADRRFALLIVLQGMDAAGKDGVIRHVMCGMSPQGVDVHGFKAPSSSELSHDYLWRCATVVPERGRTAIFNRSYYEELTVVRVHETLLAAEHVPVTPAGASVWQERYDDILAFERHLIRNGTIVLKFFLHVSKDEQRKRFLARIDDPAKNWKFSAADFHERGYWDAYRIAYDHVLSNTGTAIAPWYIIPADHKWFARAAVADVIVKKLASLTLAYPELDDAQRAAMAIDRESLVAGLA